ncbi:unnamed protein product [Closterium sp. Naga37s-1]|nr:unnamed protein product [Closterium sp. Naga37s-1]
MSINTAFHLMGAQKEEFGSILHGFSMGCEEGGGAAAAGGPLSKDLLAQAWGVEEGEVQQLLAAQQESVFVKVTPQLRAELENYGEGEEEEIGEAEDEEDIEEAEWSEEEGIDEGNDQPHVGKGAKRSVSIFTDFTYNLEARQPDIYVKRGGNMTVANGYKLPAFRKVGFAVARFSLEGNAMTTPRWLANAAAMLYVTKGKGRVEIAYPDGRQALRHDVKEGDFVVVPASYPHAAVARGLVPTEGGAPGGAGAAGQQRKGARILAAETFAHHAPLPDYLDHIPRRQTLATSRPCSPWLSFLCPPCLSFLCSLPLIPLLLASHSSAPLASHSSAPAAPHSSAPFVSHPSPLLILLLLLPLIPLLPLPLIPLLPLPPLLCAEVYACMAVTIWAHIQCLGFDLHSLTHSPLPFPSALPPTPPSVWAHDGDDPLAVTGACFNFGNVWEGILDNPDPNPSQYQQGEIFVQTTPGYCEMRMNRGASGTLQMLPGETVNIVYAYLWDFRPCVQELRFGNGNSYSMTNTTECTLAAVI